MEFGATTTCGASPCRPLSAMLRSLCSLLAGIPVEGPPRITSTTTTGTSAATARPSASVISERPGPAVAVSDGTPPNEAPMTMLIEASSSSACTSAPPTLASAGASHSSSFGRRRDRISGDEAHAAAQRAVAGGLVAGDEPARALGALCAGHASRQAICPARPRIRPATAARFAASASPRPSSWPCARLPRAPPPAGRERCRRAPSTIMFGQLPGDRLGESS